MNVLKRITALLIAGVLSLSVISVDSFAFDYNARNSAMIDYFSSRNSDFEITEDDVRIYGIYMSNFYTPFVTPVGDGPTLTAATEVLMGGSIPSGSKPMSDALIQKVANNAYEMSQPLYMKYSNTSGDGGALKDDERATISRMFGIVDGNNIVGKANLVTKDGTVFFSTAFDGQENLGLGAGTNLSKYDVGNAVFTMCLLESGVVSGDETACAVWSKLQDVGLSVTPFGDIIATDEESGVTYVVIPGCLNPYTWDADGLTFPMINDIVFKRCRNGLGTIPKTTKSETLNLAIQTVKKNIKDKRAAVLGLVIDTEDISDLITKVAPSTKDTDGTDNAATNASETLEASEGVREAISLVDNDNPVAIGVVFDQSALGTKNEDGPGLTVKQTDTLAYVFRDFWVLNPKNVQQGIYMFDFNATTGYPTADNPATVVPLYFGLDGGIPEGNLGETYNNGTGDSKDVREKLVRGGYNKTYFPLGLNNSENLASIGYSVITTTSKMSNILQNQSLSINFYPQMFYTYMMSAINPNLPAIDPDVDSLNGIMATTGQDEELEEMQKDVLTEIKALMEPGSSDKKGNFITDFLNSFILKAHRTMLGIKSNNIATVSNSGMSYSGFTGHVTTPTLMDFPFTADIVSRYNEIYVVLMGIVTACLVIMFIIKMKTWQQSVILFLVMAICLAIPQGIIDGAITLSNTVSQGLYANRFNYWAMIQHQQELQDLRDAASSENSDLAVLIASNINRTKNYYSADSIQLRWMSAKKVEDFNFLFETGEDGEPTDSLIPGANVFKFLFSGYFKQESYSSDPLATYVYRTYSSIAEAAKQNAMMQNTEAASTPDLSAYYEDYPGLLAIANGPYEAPLVDVYKPTFASKTFRQSFMGSETLNRVLANNDIQLGAGAGKYGYDITEANYTTTPINTFVLYSESPYYYFYNALANAEGGVVFDTTGEGVTSANGFLSTMLGDDMYKVTNESSQLYGMKKDFLDMEGLFTYVVPYMNSMNDIVIRFTEIRGTDYNRYGNEVGVVSVNDSEDIRRIWNIYCPWVDALYATDACSDSVRVAGKTYTITDAFNPAYYYNEGNGRASETAETLQGVNQGRPMVFGEADAYVKGVAENDMTAVELKINKVLEDTYTDMRYLANYAAFSDEVLLSAAAMIATFNFNQEFSESHIIGESITLHPQGYELKTFSYDAFLRLILLNSTGQSVMAKTDVYTAVVENTSFWTGILLVVVDALALYALPSAKLIFIVITFVLSLLMLMSCFLQGAENAPRTVMNTLVMPVLQFLGITTAHAAFTAMLMGEGLTELVGSQSGSLVTNDPTVTLLLLVLINGIASVMLIKIILGLIKQGIIWAKDTMASITGLLKGLGEKITGGITSVALTGGIDTASKAVNNSLRAAPNSSTRSVGLPHMGRNSGVMPRSFTKKMERSLNNIGKPGKIERAKNAVQSGADKLKNGARKSLSNIKAGAFVAGAAAGVVGTKAVELGSKLKNKAGAVGDKLSNTTVGQFASALSHSAKGARMMASDKIKDTAKFAKTKIKDTAGAAKNKVVLTASKAKAKFDNSKVGVGAAKLKASAQAKLNSAKQGVITAATTVKTTANKIKSNAHNTVVDKTQKLRSNKFSMYADKKALEKDLAGNKYSDDALNAHQQMEADTKAAEEAYTKAQSEYDEQKARVDAQIEEFKKEVAARTKGGSNNAAMQAIDKNINGAMTSKSRSRIVGACNRSGMSSSSDQKYLNDKLNELTKAKQDLINSKTKLCGAESTAKQQNKAHLESLQKFEGMKNNSNLSEIRNDMNTIVSKKRKLEALESELAAMRQKK